MRIAIMQPYFFPYIGYFQLMNLVDKWIVFDDTQFIDKGWINRNRILHPDDKKEWQFITLPLSKKKQFDKIKDISIAYDRPWKSEIYGKISSYKKKAPYYRETLAFLEECLASDTDNLSGYLVEVLKKTAKRLQIGSEILVQSDFNIDYGQIDHPGQWAPKISKFFNASEYINPYSGFSIFNEKDFDEINIKISYLKPKLSPYSQRKANFTAGLSILDVMMWNDLDTIKAKLCEDYFLLTHQEVGNL